MDPSLGRFISEDPAGDGVNWFTYCRNNPVSAVDANGRHPILLGALAVLAAGLMGGFFSYAFTLRPSAFWEGFAVGALTALVAFVPHIGLILAIGVGSGGSYLVGKHNGLSESAAIAMAIIGAAGGFGCGAVAAAEGATLVTAAYHALCGMIIGIGDGTIEMIENAEKRP